MWKFMWEDSGHELYEHRSTEWVAKQAAQEIGAPIYRRLELREALDTVKSYYYDLEAEIRRLKLAVDVANVRMTAFIKRFESVTQALLEEDAQRSQAVLTESDDTILITKAAQLEALRYDSDASYGGGS